MRIVPIAILLIISLLLVPTFSWFFGTALSLTAERALLTLVSIAVVAAVYCFVTGEVTGNNSQVDKLWSLLPVAYSWVVCVMGDFSTRLVLMAVLVTIWGLRLSFNFWLKGGYSWIIWQGEEDARWRVLRSRIEFQPKWKWTLFNLFFISGYQNALILMFTLPIVIAVQFNDRPIGMLDFMAAGLMLFFIVFESIADWQHWHYQTRKRSLIHSGSELSGEYAKGFLDRGLWAWSRHPNYFAEQSIWISFYLFSVSASGQWLNWSVAGCLLLIVLFQGSVAFGEEISAAKYPLYADYQKAVPRLVPWKPPTGNSNS